MSDWDDNEAPWQYRRFWESPDGNGIRSCSEGDLDFVCERWENLTRHCGSPIELDLACELFQRFTLIEQYPPYVIEPDGHGLPKMGFTLHPQMKVGRYKADLGITLIENEPDPGGDGVYFSDELPHAFYAQLVVECDGHDFHEKTKEQAARDKRRDRIFLQNGWPVVRFTGSEIRADVSECAEQVIQILRAMVDAEARATQDLRQQARERRERRLSMWRAN